MLFKGFLLGFSVAAPVGPIGLLCIQRTLSRGRLNGFVSGLGAASADAIYGLIAALGLTAISAFLLGLQYWLQLGGGLFLLWLGGRMLCANPTSFAAAQSTGGATRLFAAYVSVLFLTLANPATIISFLAIFAGIGIGRASGGPADAFLLVAGVFLGSATWWLLLSVLAGILRDRLSDGGMRLINIFAGLSILILGLWALWPLVAAKLL